MKKLNYIDIFKVPKLLGGDVVKYSDLSRIGKRRYRKDANKAGAIVDLVTGEVKEGSFELAQATINELAQKDIVREDNLNTFKNVMKGGLASAVGVDLDSTNMDEWSAIGTAAAGKVADIGMKVAGALTTGDKNFSEQSLAVDVAVGATTNTLMLSENPYLMAAAGGITAINELTKMGGQSVPGFEVDISSSGYGDIGSMEESSSRGFFAATKRDQRKLDNRNEKASLALAASSISDDQSFEQEARMNNIQNVIQNNNWALEGGVSTDLLAAKHGAKLNKVESPDFVEWLVNKMLSNNVESAKNGAKLKQVETSEEENVIPTGTLHKNKHNLDLEEITKKGIPVIQNVDDSVETFEEIKEYEKDIVQSAEIESLEIIFNKEVTDFIEERMDKASDKEVCKEVGMRLCKEILFNTKDKSDLIETLNKKEEETEQ